MPLENTTCPSTIPKVTMKWHFSQLSTKPFSTHLAKTNFKWLRQLSKESPKTDKSSITEPKARFDWPPSDHWIENIGRYVNHAHENRWKKGDHAKISQFSPRGGCPRAQILSDSWFDPQVQNFKEEDTFRHDVKLSDRRVFPQSSRNLDRKTALRQAKNPPAASIRGTISLEPKLASSQVQNFKKEGVISFPGMTRTSKIDIGSCVNHVHENWQKQGKCAENLTRFSSRTAAFARRFLPTRYELVYKFGTLRKITTPATRRNSRFASSISHLAGIFARKTRKNSSDSPTSKSHNFSVRTPIHANFISLEIILINISNGTPYDPFWASEGPQNLPRKLG